MQFSRLSLKKKIGRRFQWEECILLHLVLFESLTNDKESLKKSFVLIGQTIQRICNAKSFEWDALIATTNPRLFSKRITDMATQKRDDILSFHSNIKETNLQLEKNSELICPIFISIPSPEQFYFFRKRYIQRVIINSRPLSIHSI